MPFEAANIVSFFCQKYKRIAFGKGGPKGSAIALCKQNDDIKGVLKISSVYMDRLFNFTVTRPSNSWQHGRQHSIGKNMNPYYVAFGTEEYVNETLIGDILYSIVPDVVLRQYDAFVCTTNPFAGQKTSGNIGFGYNLVEFANNG